MDKIRADRAEKSRIVAAQIARIAKEVDEAERLAAMRCSLSGHAWVETQGADVIRFRGRKYAC